MSDQERNDKAKAVNEMFSAIADRYDFLNHFLSIGIDITWRKRATELLGPLRQGCALDLACGTADLTIELAKANPAAQITGADFVDRMVQLGKEKVTAKGLDKQITLEIGDAMNLSYPDNHFDGITCAFGVRNFADLEQGIAEMVRVLKPGGRMVILEFTQPKNVIFAMMYRFYFTRILPLLGGLVSGRRSAYDYLPDSVYKFPLPDRFSDLLIKSGMEGVSFFPLTFGICGLHAGVKR